MGRKRLLIFTNHFYPENFKVNDIAFALSREGYEITVVTGIPNYPKGKFYKGYGFFTKNKEVVDGVTIVRLPLIPRGSGKPFRLILNYFSYAFSVCCYALYIGFRKKFDAIFVHHTSPIFIGIGAVLVKKIQGIKLHFWNLDLWPESVSATTKISNSWVTGLLNKLVTWIYRNSDTILIGSKGFRQSILDKGIDDQKIVYFPNWAEDTFISIPGKHDNDLEITVPDGFKIMFAGNIGEAQDFESILNAAVLLKDTNIRWLIVGDGRKKAWVETSIRQLGLSDNVFLMGRFPLEKMPAMFKYADVMLVSLKDTPIFKLTVPAKVQAYMASQKPILAMLNGEGAALVKEADCGRTCAAEDYLALVKEITYLADLPREQLISLGANGYNYYLDQFDKNKILKRLLTLMEKA